VKLISAAATIITLMLAPGIASADFVFATGNFGVTLNANCTTNNCVVDGVTMTATPFNINASQGLGNNGGGGGNIQAGETVSLAFNASISFTGGYFRFLTQGESFSISVDGGTPIVVTAPAGTVSDNYEFLPISGLSGSTFLFTGLASTGTAPTEFRISGLVAAVPAPPMALLLGLGLIGLTVRRRHALVLRQALANPDCQSPITRRPRETSPEELGTVTLISRSGEDWGQ
jgi:hypothetical protein